MTFEVLKGTKDYLPCEQIKINLILDTIRKNFELYGFRPFDTPLVEYLDTLTNKYDDDAEIVGEIFKVTDRGERKLGLRYDLTVPLCRFIASQKQLKLPFKRYAIGKVYRDGPIKTGRTREFTQCDADVVGIKGTNAEAETLKMFFETYKELDINAILELNNNKILRGALLQEGFEETQLSSIILSIDKLKKIKEEGVLKEIKGKGFNTEKAQNSIKILSSKTFEEIETLAKNDELKEGIEELKELTNTLTKFNVNFRINFSMSRGLAIYTGNIWEVYDTNNKISSSLGSGGRYDKVIGNYVENGKEYPAFGVSFGLVPILACLPSQTNSPSNTQILIAPLDEDLFEPALKIANKLRKEGKNVEIDYNFKLKKAFTYCESLEIRELVILGNNDLKEGVYTLKNLRTKKETKVKF